MSVNLSMAGPPSGRILTAQDFALWAPKIWERWERKEEFVVTVRLIELPPGQRTGHVLWL